MADEVTTGTAAAASGTAAPVNTATGTNTTTTTTDNTGAAGTTADAAAAAAAAGTTTTNEAPAAGDWPSDWREKLAGGDEKRLAELKRYASPQAVDDARRSAAERIRKGQIRQPLAEDATPEQVAEYRRANGIPETPEKYDTTLPEGMVIGEADKPLVEGFLKTAHDANLTPEAVKTSLSWYYQEMERQRAERFDKDVETKNATIAALREEYGPDYKRELGAAHRMFAELGEDFAKSVLESRMPDGTLFGAHPKVVRFFINKAKELDPYATVVPSGQGGAQATVETELAALTAEMGDPEGPYWKGPLAKSKQARVDELNTMMARAQKRG